MTIGELVDAIASEVSVVVTAPVVGRAAGATAIAVATLYFRRMARMAVRGAAERARIDPAVLVVMDRAIQVGILVVGASWVAAMFGLQLGAVLTILGVSGVAVGLALQDVLKHVIAGVYLMVERPFTLGDLVAVPAGVGTVRRIDLLATGIEMADGTRVVVPNAWFIVNAVTIHRTGAKRGATLRVVVRATHPEACDGPSLRAAVRDCLDACPAVDRNSPSIVLVSAWTDVGPVVDVQVSCVDRATMLDEAAWALRGRFGIDLVEFREA